MTGSMANQHWYRRLSSTLFVTRRFPEPTRSPRGAAFVGTGGSSAGPAEVHPTCFDRFGQSSGTAGWGILSLVVAGLALGLTGCIGGGGGDVAASTVPTPPPTSAAFPVAPAAPATQDQVDASLKTGGNLI